MANEKPPRPRLLLCMVGAFLTMAAAAERPPSDRETEHLLEKHREWRGGRAALSALHDLTWSGAWSGSGLAGTVTLRESSSGWRHRQRDLGVAVTVEVVGPGGAWVRNLSGQVERMAPADADTEKREARRDFGAFLLAAGDAERRDLGSEEREGRRWRVVRFGFADGDSFDLFLDPADGSCTWIRETRDAETHWTRLDDWRRVAGVRLPFEERSLHEDARLDETYRWTSVQAGQASGDAAFGPPPSTFPGAHIGGGEATAPLPVDLAEGRWAYLSGSIAGRKVPLLLDSGAQTTVVSRELATELGLSAAGEIRLQGTLKAQGASLARDVEIDVGGLKLPGLTVVLTDLRGLAEAMGRETPVVLGREIFNAVLVDLDYPSSRITFHARSAYRPDPAAHVLPLRPGPNGHLLVEASVEGLPPAPLVLDSGSGDTLALFQDFIRQHRLLDGRSPLSQSYARGIGGGAVASVATLRTFTLAGFTFKDVPAKFHAASDGGFSTRRASGNLGAGILERFRVVFDFAGERVYLTPGPGWDRRPFRKNRAGIEADFRGSFLEVVFVAPDSPAARAGWKPGQRITAIGDRPIGPDYLRTQGEWAYGPAGSSVDLAREDGTRQTLVLTDYY